MHTQTPLTESDLSADELIHYELLDAAADSTEDGYIVFSLGPNFDEAVFDA
jgi:hypothetical protein